MRKIFLILFTIITFSTISCGDFLTEYSQNLSYVVEAEDLDELLIGNAYWTVSKSDPFLLWHLNAMDDDVVARCYAARDEANPSNSSERVMYFYQFQEYPFRDDISSSLPGSPESWNTFYERINGCNVILYEAERFIDDPLYDKIKGEAYFLRAFYYFYMTNIWGAPYNTETSATDLAVPIKISEVVEDIEFTRNTVKECYDQILSDALAAVAHLENVEFVSTWRGGISAARALLARTYLYMGEYALAEEQCDLIIDDPRFYLYDMNGATGSVWGATKKLSTCSETIFTGSWCTTALIAVTKWNLTASDELLACYGDNDLRYVDSKTETPFFDYRSTSYPLLPWAASTYFEYGGFGFDLPEVYLIKAEAAAMQDKDEAAITALRTLRKSRMSVDEEINLSGEELVTFVRTERRRELCFKCHRWFDLRRYAVSPKYPVETTIRHDMYEYDATNKTQYWTGYYELAPYPGDGGWVLPIPNDALLRNDGSLVQNVRPDRPLLQNE